MKINNEIVREVSEYVASYLDRKLSKSFCYHNLSHTTSVVKAVELLCSAIGTTDTERKILQVAAWFHDIGFTKQTLGHEKEGAIIASRFLKNKNIDEEEIAMVTGCIISTQLPQQPANLLQQIICDADLLYLTDTDMIQRASQLRREWAVVLNKVFTESEWYELNIRFVTSHTFHTQYCKDQFNYRKLNNIKQLTALLQELNYADLTPKNIAA